MMRINRRKERALEFGESFFFSLFFLSFFFNPPSGDGSNLGNPERKQGKKEDLDLIKINFQKKKKKTGN